MNNEKQFRKRLAYGIVYIVFQLDIREGKSGEICDKPLGFHYVSNIQSILAKDERLFIYFA